MFALQLILRVQCAGIFDHGYGALIAGTGEKPGIGYFQLIAFYITGCGLPCGPDHFLIGIFRTRPVDGDYIAHKKHSDDGDDDQGKEQEILQRRNDRKQDVVELTPVITTQVLPGLNANGCPSLAKNCIGRSVPTDFQVPSKACPSR